MPVGNEPASTSERSEGRSVPTSRRSLLAAGLGVGIGGVAFAASNVRDPALVRQPSHRPGADGPPAPPKHLLLTVYRLPDLDGPELRRRLPTLLEDLGSAASEAARTTTAGSSLDQEGPLLRIGLGPRLVAAIDSNLPGAAPLPLFAGDERLEAYRRGGDLIVSLQGADANHLAAVRAELERRCDYLHHNWDARGSRPDGALRNPFGFHDEVVNPTTHQELEGVRLPAGPAAGATIAVVRLLKLDLAGFSHQPSATREAIIGRREANGAPLSGGNRHDEVDLLARDPEGRFLVPEGAHVRAARRPYSHRTPMLRRSYHTSIKQTDGTVNEGMIFLAQQRSLATFISTQRRLDREDRLMHFVETLASGSFLILPAFDKHRPLGRPLFT